MNLVIVESPTKARTIGKFLGNDYQILASMGHIMDLPKSTLGVDLEKDFEPDYQVMPDKKKTIAQLKAAAKNASSIILATDPDREGEAIASHVVDMLGLKSKIKNQKSKITRMVFHEITKEAVEQALKNPREVDENLVDAQTARRVLDRLVGYKLSPLLWQKVRRGLSAGRVQSVALRLIVEREREIEKFKKEPYWTIGVLLRQNRDGAQVAHENFLVRGAKKDTSINPDRDPANSHSENFVSFPHQDVADEQTPRSKDGTDFELVEINGQKIEIQNKIELYDGQYQFSKTIIDNEKKAESIVADLQTKQFIVSDVSKKEMRRFPLPPYTTSTLQQDASRRLGFWGKRTMSIAQKLYEEGFITYHRTDSVAMALSAQNAIRLFVQKTYGEKYVPQKPRFYKTKQKLAQEAHEAIRPTKAGVAGAEIRDRLGNDFGKLYDLIWRRAVASQMSDAVTESTSVNVIASEAKQSPVISILSEVEGEKSQGDLSTKSRDDKKEIAASPAAAGNDYYTLKANGSVLLFDGFLKVNPQGLDDKRLPQFKTQEKLDFVDVRPDGHETQAPPRYNDASLIKTLEEKGIGRPSTYATIISTIESRGYIEREQNRFSPASVGIAVTDFLVKNFADIDDIPFTAEMEDSLDAIANGEKQWRPMMKEFYVPFEQKLAVVKNAQRVKIAVEETNEKCPQCQNNLVIRSGRFGKFLSCSTFPDCKFTKPIVQETNFTCPKCGFKIIIKKTRRGRKFYGCSNYPNCDFAVWKLEDLNKEKSSHHNPLDKPSQTVSQ